MNDPSTSELVVIDHEESCPYLPDRTARLPLRWPLSGLTPDQLDERLAAGDRRTGTYLYRTQCPTCAACEPIRIDVSQFEFNRTQRRVVRRGQRMLETHVGPPRLDPHRVSMFNEHRWYRGLAPRDHSISDLEYRDFLIDTCCDTIEFSHYQAGQLVAVAIADRGVDSISAVYCYYDMRWERLSLGTYSILSQIQWCRDRQIRYLYLGLYVADSPHMRYKAGFVPHQRLIAGHWRAFSE